VDAEDDLTQASQAVATALHGASKQASVASKIQSSSGKLFRMSPKITSLMR
jgi:hypothetical protein